MNFTMSIPLLVRSCAGALQISLDGSRLVVNSWLLADILSTAIEEPAHFSICEGAPGDDFAVPAQHARTHARTHTRIQTPSYCVMHN